MLAASTMVVGGRYNWKGQENRMIYLGRRRYPNDSRGWFQFEKVGEPGHVWCEVLESDLHMLEETVDGVESLDEAISSMPRYTTPLMREPVGKAEKKAAKKARQRARG